MSAASKYSLHVKNGFVVLFFWDILPFTGAFAHLHINVLLEMSGDLYKVFCFHSLNEAGQWNTPTVLLNSMPCHENSFRIHHKMRQPKPENIIGACIDMLNIQNAQPCGRGGSVFWYTERFSQWIIFMWLSSMGFTECLCCSPFSYSHADKRLHLMSRLAPNVFYSLWHLLLFIDQILSLIKPSYWLGLSSFPSRGSSPLSKR